MRNSSVLPVLVRLQSARLAPNIPTIVICKTCSGSSWKALWRELGFGPFRWPQLMNMIPNNICSLSFSFQIVFEDLLLSTTLSPFPKIASPLVHIWIRSQCCFSDCFVRLDLRRFLYLIFWGMHFFSYFCYLLLLNRRLEKIATVIAQ